MRPTEATIDLAAIGRNTERLVSHVAPASVCAVVKADGYGHGAVAAGRAALAAGASQLAVALVEEGRITEPRWNVQVGRHLDLQVSLGGLGPTRVHGPKMKKKGQKTWMIHSIKSTGLMNRSESA